MNLAGPGPVKFSITHVREGRCPLQDPVRSCPQAYVGQTGRSLSHRAKEHLRACRNGDTELSAVAEHAWSSGHAVAWDDMAVLDRSSRLHERCTLEAWHIRSQPHPINRERGRLSRGPTIFFYLDATSLDLWL